jgi:ferric-dicitrate binding protein FerR (iron transport regulator)
MIDERFADNCRKEAEECEREAARALSPLNKEAWLRLSREWTKLAGPASPPKARRQT